MLPTQKASRQFCGEVPYSDAHLAMSRINGGINLSKNYLSSKKMRTLSTMCTHGSLQKLAYVLCNQPYKASKARQSWPEVGQDTVHNAIMP